MRKHMIIALLILITVLLGCNNKKTSYVNTPVPTTNEKNSHTNTPAPTIYVDKTAKEPSKKDLEQSDKYFAQAEILYNEYKYDEAIELCNKTITLNPQNYAAYAIKGIALCFKGSYKEGMSLLNKALTMQPEYVPTIYNTALGYKLQKDYDNSLIWFNKAIALDPKNVWSYYGISTIYADRNNVAQSLIYLKKAIELDTAVKGVAKNQSHFDRMRNNTEFIKLVN